MSVNDHAPLTPSPKGSRPVYDRLASRYDRAIAPLERRFLARLRAETLGELPPDGRLLEVGAGTGLNFPYYPQPTLAVTTELSREMLLRAQVKGRPEGVHLVQTCGEQLPFADASFDAACATLVLCSVASPARVFAELRRVVKPGGKVALLEHVRPPGLLGPLFDLLNLFTVRLMDDHFNRRTTEEARRAGLNILSVKTRALGIINIITCENGNPRPAISSQPPAERVQRA